MKLRKRALEMDGGKRRNDAYARDECWKLFRSLSRYRADMTRYIN